LADNRFDRAWAEVMAKVWGGDESLRQKLISDPKAAFADFGAKIPDGINVVVIENAPGQVHFVLPLKPAELAVVSDSALTELYRACPGTVCAT
jgi:hypothetical protein